MKSIFDSDYRQIVQKLRKARLSKNLSQVDVADRLGYSQSYISKIEQGQIRLDVVQLKVLAKALGTDIKKLLE